MKTNKNLFKTVLATLILGLGTQLVAMESPKRQRGKESEQETALQPGEAAAKKGRAISAVEEMAFNPQALEWMRWNNQQDPAELTLQSSDGDDFVIPVHTAQLSETIRNLIEDAGTCTPIPLPNVDSSTLAKIIKLLPELEWLIAKAGRLPQVPENGVKYVMKNDNYVLQQDELLYIPRAFQSIINNVLENASTNEVVDLFLAANYLDIPFILNGAAAVLADRKIGPTQMDRIPKDLRPYIERHVVHRKCGIMQEYSIADYIREHGQPELNSVSTLSLNAKGLTSLFGIQLVQNETTKKTQELYLSGNCLFNLSLDPQRVEKPFSYFTNATILYLFNNHLTNLDPQLFAGPTKLEYLDLGDNQFTEAEKKRIREELKRIEDLDI